MQIWFEFYAVIGGATATLVGLLFVAVSINASAILSEAHESSKRLAEQALQNYLAVLLISLLALFPSLKLSELGFATLVLTAVWGVWVLMRLYLVLRRSHDAGWRLQPLRRQFLSLFGFIMLAFAAIRMALNLGDSRNFFAIATIILLFSATRASWELMLTIAKVKHAHPSEESVGPN
jgi:hypothetical protein